LKILSLSLNGLSGSIPPTISNMSSLEQIYLNQNYLSGTSNFDIMCHICDISLFPTNCDIKISI
jgi:hypothetical protein